MSTISLALERATKTGEDLAILMGALSVLMGRCEAALQAFRQDGTTALRNAHLAEAVRLYQLASGLSEEARSMTRRARADVELALSSITLGADGDGTSRVLASVGKQSLDIFAVVDRTTKQLVSAAAVDAELLREMIGEEDIAPDVVDTVSRLFARMRRDRP